MRIAVPSRKKAYLAAAVTAVVVLAGAAVAIGAVNGLYSAPSSGNAQLNAVTPAFNGRVYSGEPVEGAPSVDASQPAGASTGNSSSAAGSATPVTPSSKASDAAKAEESAVATTAPTPTATSATLKVTGQVSCLSGNPVEGVWVQADDGAGFASWKGLGDGATADWWFTLPENEPYSLHVGCGGSPSSWEVALDSPTVTGAHNSFSCYDIEDEAQYGSCALR
jgi:hypothetical protein